MLGNVKSVLGGTAVLPPHGQRKQVFVQNFNENSIVAAVLSWWSICRGVLRIFGSRTKVRQAFGLLLLCAPQLQVPLFMLFALVPRLLKVRRMLMVWVDGLGWPGFAQLRPA